MIRRCMRRITYPFTNRTKWNEEPYVNINGLSCAQNTITIKLPKGIYTGVGTHTNAELRCVEIEATFSIKCTLEGTPTAVVSKLGRSDLEGGEVYQYIEGSNRWLFSREVCILNNEVVYLMLPSAPKMLIIGVGMMTCSSRMAKLFREKVIPDVIVTFGSNITVKIMNTFDLTVKSGVTPTRIVSDNEIRDILLEHIDKIL